jgi:hypothetical protein
MSANIGLSLSSTKIETTPGKPVEVILKIRNLGIIVDRFHIKVEGLDPAWWTLSIPTFASFPGDHGPGDRPAQGVPGPSHRACHHLQIDLLLAESRERDR